LSGFTCNILAHASDFRYSSARTQIREESNDRAYKRRIDGPYRRVGEAGHLEEDRQVGIQGERERWSQCLWPRPLPCHALLRTMGALAWSGRRASRILTREQEQAEAQERRVSLAHDGRNCGCALEYRPKEA